MKRLTKQQKHSLEIAAIESRLYDMLQGAWGGWSIKDYESVESIVCTTSPETLFRFIGACKETWPCEGKDWVYSVNNLHHFDSIHKPAGYLHSHGVRA